MDHADPQTYNFDPYLEALGENWLAEDELIQRWLAGSALDKLTLELVEGFGRAVATRYRRIAEAVAAPAAPDDRTTS